MPVGEGIGCLSLGGRASTENIDIFGKKGEKNQAKSMHGTENVQNVGKAPTRRSPCCLAPAGHFLCVLWHPGGAAWSAPQGVHFTENRLILGKDVIEGARGGKNSTDRACKGADFSTGGRRPRRRHRRTHAHPRQYDAHPTMTQEHRADAGHPCRRVVVRNHEHPLAHEDTGHDQQEHRPQHGPLLASR